jgi:selenocysteine lyase/cysteine desulfurase
VFVSHSDPARNDEIHQRLGDAGIGAAFRRGKLRFSPHLYNTNADIEKALAVLNDA